MKRQVVLHGISASIQRGRTTGFLGANGAGKTTLIHLIVGIRKPLAGRVLLDGAPTDEATSRARMGYLPERPYFYEHLTGRRILLYFAQLSGVPRDERDSRIDHALEVVGLQDSGGKELRNYSKGMLQRIGIAQAILHDPELLILDEPMSGLDPIGRREIRQLIQDLRAKGTTIFFSSHVVSDVEAICDDVIAIQKGKVLGCGPIAEVASKFGTLEGIFTKEEDT